MRGSLVFLFILILVLPVRPQCEPDFENCIDVNQPGQICPRYLATGNVGSEYLETITIIAPDTVTILNIPIRIEKITLDSIHNLPPGLDFYGETTEFMPDGYYCVSISGTPANAGTYYLKIYVTPYINVYNNLVSLGAQVDSTSVSITIEPSLGIESIKQEQFSLIYAYPNPFMTSTRIGYIEPANGLAELRIMSMLGKVLYHERIQAVKGENYFNFSGDELPPGYYVYSISREGESLQGKLLKRE
jgi:hypothetical protein